MNRNWKRILCALLATVLTLLCFGGCDRQQDNVPETTQSPEDPVLTQRREQVLEKMRQMQSILWRVEEPITYSKYGKSQGVESDESDDVVTLQPGRIYRGIPYTHGSGSEQAFMDFAIDQDENGVYTIAGIETNDLSGQDEVSVYVPRIGNDCADAVFWAWATVSTSISYKDTQYMTEKHGCLKVGDYTCDYEKYISTEFTCNTNGQQKMYEAYAQLKPADAVVTSPKGSHAMMVSSVYVAYTDDGEVDGERSYIDVVHQTSGNLFKEKTAYDERLNQEVYHCGGIDDRFFFSKLFEKCYLPVTIQELVDPTPIAEAVAQMPHEPTDPQTMFTGSVISNFRICDVTLTVADSQGNTVQQSTCYGREKEMYELNLERFTWDTEQSSLRGVLNLETLEPGTYTISYSCRVSTGDVIDVGCFTFVK